MTDLDQRVLSFVAHETGYNLKRLSPESHLVGDIGLDGDDAVELFGKFESTFKVDLTSLHEHWHLHFQPEGTSLHPSWLFAVGIAVILSDLLKHAYPPIPQWGWMIALLVVCHYIHSTFFVEPQPPMIPIMVRDLVAAARQQRWSQLYEQEPAMMFTDYR